MKTNTLSKLIAVLCGSLYLPIVLAHPGHQHSKGITESLLHTVQTEWPAAVVSLVLLGLAGYFYGRKSDKE